MNEIYEILTWGTFLTLFSLVLGILASWYISKYFFFKKKRSALQLAKRFKKADFGDYFNIAQEKKMDAKENDFFGNWHIKSDGTLTDTKNRLCWIRAPWGTIWDGEKFVGKPITVNWHDASNLFGKGIYVKHYDKSPVLNKSDITSKNYKKGSCKVTFAGSEDWRLPTSSEFETLHYYPPNESDIDTVNLYKAEWNKLKMELFPGFKSDTSNYNAWSADEAGSNCAWISNRLYSLSDQKVDKKYFVLFVRTINSNELENERKQLL